MRFADGLPLADKFWMISSLKQDFVITRINDNTLTVTSDKGMIDEIEATLRNLQRNPFTTDFHITLTDLDIAVTQVMPGGKPQELTLTFSNNRLATTRILSWNGKSFALHNVPAPGSPLTLPLKSNAQ
jgi:hypothetical protein